MSLSRIAWLTVVAACVIAVVILLISGYIGYAVVIGAVGASAAINLLLAVAHELGARPHPVLGLEVDQHVGVAQALRISSWSACAVACASSRVVPDRNWTCMSTWRRAPARRVRSLW